MRILHVNAGNLHGGIETLLITLARERSLCPTLEPHFALFFEGRLSSVLRETGVPVHLLGETRVRRPWTVLRARQRLAELLRGQSFDVVVTHGCWPHIMAAPPVRRAGLPLVFWMHNFQSGRQWLERWACWYPPDLVLANSLATLATQTNLFPRVLGELLYYPVSAPEGLDREIVRRQVRAELGSSTRATVIVAACRLEPWKGHTLLLEALARLAGVPDWECWIVGGPQRPHEERYLTGLRQRASALGLEGRVRFLGQRTDVARLLAAADIHCQPNTGPEPFGIAFIEALYAGLAVVTTALGGPLEILKEHTGFLVPPDDASALAAVLGELIGDPERRFRQREIGPTRAAELCDPRSQMRKLGAYLEKVAGLRRREPAA